MVLRGAVQQHVQVRADVHVAQLQRPREGEDERYVLLLRHLLADDLDVGLWARREAAGQRRVVVDVELEEVEERVVDKGDGAVDLALDAVVELERLVCLFADGEGGPFELVGFVLDMLSGFAVDSSANVPGEIVRLLERGSPY